jgi:hypothetical protein
LPKCARSFSICKFVTLRDISRALRQTSAKDMLTEQQYALLASLFSQETFARYLRHLDKIDADLLEELGTLPPSLAKVVI